MKNILLSALFSLITTLGFSQAPNYVPVNGLVGWWPFNGNADDESGNGNNGTVNGATMTTDRNGVANQAYSFDGIDNYIATNSLLNASEDFSFSCWVNSNNNSNQTILNTIPHTIIFFGINAWWAGAGNIGFLYGTGDSFGWLNNNYYFPNPNLFQGVWVNHLIVKNGLNWKFYQNGVLIHNYNAPSNPASTISQLVFGHCDPSICSATFNGKIDDIGMWNRTLTDCEIQNLYNSSNPTNTTASSACNNYTWNGTTYTTSGVYTGPTANCITESLNLTITPSSTNTISASACGSYVWNGTTYTASGTYTGNTANCVTESLDLTITPSSTNTTTATACDSYLWNGTNYTSSGVYTGTTTNCIAESLNLTITPSSTNTTTATACNNLTWNGTTYTASGVYTGTTANCVTESLNLTITPSSTNTTAATACDTYTWNGQTYTSSGVYAGNTANCVTESLNLTITPSSNNTTTATACDSYLWNGTNYSESGVYTGTTTNCLTESLNLTITPSSTITQPTSQSINISNNAQFIVGSSGSNAIYQWQTNLGFGFQNLNNAGQYNGTTSSTLSVLNLSMSNNNQVFRCIISSGSCTDTSDVAVLTVVNNAGINDLSASKLSIYPNPTNGDFTITGLELLGTLSSLTLTDMNGKVVKVLDTKATKFSMGSIKPGVYFLNIRSGNKQEVLKIVKE